MLIVPTLEQENASKLSTPSKSKAGEIQQKVIIDHIQKFGLYRNNANVKKLKSDQVKIEPKSNILGI